MTWPRIARLGVAATGLVCAVAIIWYFRDSPPEAAPVTLKPTDEAAVAEGGAATRIMFGKAERRVSLSSKAWARYENPDRMIYSDAEIVFESEGLTIHADEAEVRGDTVNQEGPNEVALAGNIRIATDDGLVLTTPRATYDNATGMVDMPEQVAFTKGRLSGQGVGGTYNRQQELFQLLDQAHITVTPAADGTGAIDAHSKAMTIARQEKFTRLEGAATIVRPTETLTADTTTIYFTDDETDIKLADLQGHAAVMPAAGASGAPPDMQAENISLTFDPATRGLDRATLNGNGRVVLAGTSGAKSIVGQWIDIVTGRDGATVTRLESRNQVRVTLPREGTTPGRTIDAATLVSTGEEGKGLTRARFDSAANGVVKFSEEAQGSAASRVATSKVLVLALDGSLEAISQADFSVGVRFESGDTTATSEWAVYRAARAATKAELQLRRPTGAAVQPEVIQPGLRVAAREIDLGLETQDVAARGDVRTKMQQSGTGARTASALFDAGKDVFGAADTLQYTSASGLAVYRGGAGGGAARLWQDDGSTVAGREVSLDEKKGTLTAKEAVESTVFVIEPATASGQTPATPAAPARYVITADSLDYADSTRRAVYRGNLATLASEGRRTEGTEIAILLAAKGRTLEGFKASGKVYTKFDVYEATGDQLDYDSAKDMYVLSGRPVVALGPSDDGKSCVKVTGILAQIDRATRQISWPDPPNRGVVNDPSWPCGKSIR